MKKNREEDIIEAEIEEVPQDSHKTEDEDTSNTSMLMVIGIVFVAILVIWIVSILQPLVQMVLVSSGSKLIIAYVMLAIPVIAIAVSIIALLYQYFKTPKLINFNRVKFNNDKRLAKILRKKYLPRWRGYEFSMKQEHNAEKLNECLDWLRKKDIKDGKAWLDKVAEFQKELDVAADEAISKFSRRIGGYAVLSQAKITDMITVIFFSTLMLRYLCGLYRQRVSLVTAFRLSCFWITNVYFAGWLQGNMKAIGRKISKAFGSVAKFAIVPGAVTAEAATVGASGGAAGALAATLIGKGAASAISYGSEFLLNKILAKQLGMYYKKNLHVLIDESADAKKRSNYVKISDRLLGLLPKLERKQYAVKCSCSPLKQLKSPA